MGGFRGRRSAVLALVGAVVFAGAAAATAQAAGTKLLAAVTATGHLSSTFTWTISKQASPASQAVPVGSSASVGYSITTIRSASGTTEASLTGRVCVANLGSVATQGLKIGDQLTRPPSKSVLSTVSVDVSARPVLLAGHSFCYPYTMRIPPAAIAAGASYTDTAHVAITNEVGHIGTLAGPSPSVSAALPQSASVVNQSITVSDSNGKSFNFNNSATVSYNQSFPCLTAEGPHTISNTNTATIQATGQSAQALATIHCNGTTTLTTKLPQSTLAPDTPISDQATISGAAPTAGGTITYTVYTDNSCNNVYRDATPTNNAVVNGQAPASTPTRFPNTGSFWWVASYSGDPNTSTLPSKSGCASEPLTVKGWKDGELTTYGQVGWLEGSTGPAAFLVDNFSTANADSGGTLFVGDTEKFVLVFTDGQSVIDYLSGAEETPPPAALDSSLLNPKRGEDSSGPFGSDVVALKLNVEFSDAGLSPGTSGLKFGDLALCNFSGGLADLNGMSARDFLGVASTALGGGPTPNSIESLDTITQELNGSFDGGVNTFAVQHLGKDASCQPVPWQHGELTTYTQADWETGAHQAFDLLEEHFPAVYASVGGSFVVGDLQNFVLVFEEARVLAEYLPTSGPSAALNSSLVDPDRTEEPSGVFGGSVIALKLDVDYSDAGVLPGTSGLRFGDLTLCNLSDPTEFSGFKVSINGLTGLNGMSVRALLSAVETALGAGPTPSSIQGVSYENLRYVTEELTSAFFEGGYVTPFAQEHLVNGPCP